MAQVCDTLEMLDAVMQPSDFGIGRLFWTVRDAVIVGNARSGTIVLWNPAAERMFGYTEAEALGQLLEIIVPPALREAHRAGLRRFVTGGHGAVINAPTPVELPAITKAGEEIFVELTLTPIDTPAAMHAEPPRQFVAAVVRDVTERRHAQEQLAQLNRHHHLILSAAGEGIYGLDVTGTITFVNPAAAQMVGYKPEELIGQDLHPLVHHMYPDGTPYPIEECPVNAAVRDGQVHHVIDEVFWRRDGTPLPVEYVSTPIVEGGQISGAVVVFKDITERKQTEVVREQLAKEQAARAEAEAATRVRDSLLASASHDLKNPLTSIIHRHRPTPPAPATAGHHRTRPPGDGAGHDCGDGKSDDCTSGRTPGHGLYPHRPAPHASTPIH